MSGVSSVLQREASHLYPMGTLSRILVYAMVAIWDAECIRPRRYKTVERVTPVGGRNCSLGRPVQGFVRVIGMDYSDKLHPYMSIEMVAYKNIPQDATYILDVYKCGEREAEWSCEFYVALLLNDWCYMLNQKNQFYSSVYNSSIPKLVCPIKAGVYRVPKLMLGAELISYLAEYLPTVRNYYWKVRQKIKKGRRMLHCAEIILKMEKVRI
ncbi:hypothetical protein AAG570_005253 [Ranatra chinensis]|uniref:Uncharacterized protein n=1 Tax=Ranatra chinensis TaxID=642074 RepID=A0ABD0XZX9_9HEMI